MAQQVIDVGTSASDGTGDPLRDAFTKINDNFTELYGTVENEGLTYGNVSSNVGGVTFNVTRYAESYVATPVLEGTGQSIGNVYVIRGNVLGGSTPVNDVYLTVTTLANAVVGNIATVSASGVPIAPVLRVNGLTGNVTLTVNNIDGAASRAYVNAAIAANVANVTGTVTDSLNANITAANAVISNHSARITTLESNAATQATAIDNLNNTKATISYVDTSIDLALSSNAILADVSAVNANVAAANAAIALKADLSGAIFNGNVQAGNLIANTGIVAASSVKIGENLSTAYVNAGGSFVGNVNDYYQLFVQNLNSNGYGQLVILSDIGQVSQNYIAIGIAGSTWSDALYPNASARDGTVDVNGGNLVLSSETHDVTIITSNITRVRFGSTGAITLQSGTSIVFPDGSIQNTAFGGNADVTQINANITAANAAIISLQSNASAQALSLDNLTSNAAAQAAQIISLTSNAALQASDINTINANIGSYQILANANSSSQAVSIDSINANISAANINITTLLANAATQSLELNNLQSNAQAQQGNIIALQSNAVIQASQIDLLNANVISANTNISSLTANSATQAVQIGLLNSNVAAANLNIVSLTSNAASQALDIQNLYANVNFYLSNVSTSNANIAAANARIITIDANLGTTNTNVTNLQSNAAAQAVLIDLLNANVSAANVNINNKADLSGAIFSGNVQADFLLVNANVKVGSTLAVGNDNLIDYAGLGAIFVGNVDGFYQVVIQNTNTGSSASGDFVIIADDGDISDKYLNIGINSSNFSGTFTTPLGDTGLNEAPYDGYFNVIGGNAIVRTNRDVFLVANTSVAGITKDGDFVLFSCNLRFNDGSTQASAITDVPGLYANIGTLALFQSNVLGNATYTPNNAANYNGTITNIQEALDELAARLRALGG
jgi:uncharacterized coiled-coil protein SlyX